ncbi:MAG: DMT family transporter [Chitinophagaceae bacterium]
MKKAFTQLHSAVFLAGFTGILGRLITLNEGMIVWYRLLLTAITMWALFGLSGNIRKIPAGLLLRIAGVGFIATLHWITFYGAIKYSNVSVTLVCFSSISFFTALLEPLILRKKLNRAELLLGLVTLAGIYIIFRFDTQYKTGIVIGIVSAFLAALFPVYNREYLKQVNVETLLVWQQTGGLVVLSALLPLYLSWFPVAGFLPSLSDLAWLLVLSWVCSVLAFRLAGYALHRLSAFTVNLTYNLEPIYGILLAFVVYNENQLLSKWFYIGFGVIAAALVIHIWLVIKQEKGAAAAAALPAS